MFVHSLYLFYFEYYNNVVADEPIFIDERMYKNMPNLARSCYCSIESFFFIEIGNVFTLFNNLLFTLI